MSVGYRGGVAPAVGSLSILSNTTAAGFGSFAFFETKMRPPPVAVQSVFGSDSARCVTDTYRPCLSAPYVGPVRRPAGDGSPSAFQSSQASPGRSYRPLPFRSPKLPFQMLQLARCAALVARSGFR